MTKTQKFLRAFDKACIYEDNTCFYKDINFIDAGKRYFIRASTKNDGQFIEWIIFPKRDIAKNGDVINVYTFFDIKENEQLQVLDKNIHFLLKKSLENSKITYIEKVEK